MPRLIFAHSSPIGWPTRILAALTAGLILVMGLFFGMLMLGIAGIAALGFGIRIWWLRRQSGGEWPHRRSSAPGAQDQGTRGRPGHLIEGEYRNLGRSRRADH